jgi:membrane protease YdiL (CAAX protease family)
MSSSPKHHNKPNISFMIATEIWDFSWDNKALLSFLPIILVAVFFSVYWFVAQSETMKKYFHGKYPPDEASVYHISFNRLIGFLAMGLIPGIIFFILVPEYKLSNLGLGLKKDTLFFTLIWAFGLSIVAMTLAFFSAKNPKNLLHYPQIRARIWTKKTVLLNIVGWVLYLLGYEFLFRGILLFPLAETLGVWPAIAVNIALYSTTHIPKGMQETLGAIPFGLILSLLTLTTGSIFIAFVVHLAMALTNSFTALKLHPKMQFKNK